MHTRPGGGGGVRALEAEFMWVNGRLGSSGGVPEYAMFINHLLSPHLSLLVLIFLHFRVLF